MKRRAHTHTHKIHSVTDLFGGMWVGGVAESVNTSACRANVCVVVILPSAGERENYSICNSAWCEVWSKVVIH